MDFLISHHNRQYLASWLIEPFNLYQQSEDEGAMMTAQWWSECKVKDSDTPEAWGHNH